LKVKIRRNNAQREEPQRNPLRIEGYSFAATILVLAGAAILALSLLVYHSNGFAALGIAAILIGVTAASLPRKLEASGGMQVMIEDAAISTDRILASVLPYLEDSKESRKTQNLVDLETQIDKSPKEQEAQLGRTVFLPPNGSIVRAFVPTKNSNARLDPSQMKSAPFAGALSTTSHPENLQGVLVYPVGATVPNIPELKTDQDSTTVSIQDALEFVLVESTELCTSLNSSEIGENVIVEMDGIKIKTQGKSYVKYLGSIPASLAAAVVATVKSKAVSIVDESDTLDRKLVRLKVWS
jgi:hypothetical protein